jgi:hypothetical protein
MQRNPTQEAKSCCFRTLECTVAEEIPKIPWAPNLSDLLRSSIFCRFRIIGFLSPTQSQESNGRGDLAGGSVQVRTYQLTARTHANPAHLTCSVRLFLASKQGAGLGSRSKREKSAHSVQKTRAQAPPGQEHRWFALFVLSSAFFAAVPDAFVVFADE